ncbi:MAG: acetyl-CoA hydrolase/transferase C-terminal domain-containing protein [Oscillibacter ruminantium]|uniref:acetyl-CoA hydrolase/transferase family protein n=1 Tax=Oscillibacter ruminantium TaxID=1263547 RepID=UPI002B20DE85|nr:acetyl-CoA hydrolase/transferase C-terminal domain-containing protein [Oscillibacter ruminantium]MEA5041153.1 acetyl-CoA hydrolase/transferase C-terminal domain-containing protein [Oscillibacter ruminantium]
MKELQPTRRGRLTGQMDWKAQYQALLTDAEKAAAQVSLDGPIAISGASNWPEKFDAALANRLLRENGHIELDALFMLHPTALMGPDCRDHVTCNSDFFTLERKFAAQGNLHFVPAHLGKTGAWMASRSPKTVVAAVSPPNAEGWMSRSLWSGTLNRCVFERPDVRLIVVVNRNLPYICSDGEEHALIHVSEVDGIIEDDFLLTESTVAPADQMDRAIAGYIAEMVPDGACVQFGLGGLANAVGSCLAHAGKRDLGLHTEVLTNCVMELVEKGVITGAKKQLLPGRLVTSHIVGDKALWRFAADNPAVCLKEVSWTNEPRNICQNDKVVSINNAMEIDLTGQVNAETVGATQYSGTGGQLEWVIGSQWSRGGKSVIALRSAYRDRDGQLRSKIVPTLALGAAVTTPRTFVQYVVTEYGVADLRYKSTLERAKALISIAHPDFREELKKSMPF